jgi:hypothetical protein
VVPVSGRFAKPMKGPHLALMFRGSNGAPDAYVCVMQSARYHMENRFRALPKKGKKEIEIENRTAFQRKQKF